MDRYYRRRRHADPRWTPGAWAQQWRASKGAIRLERCCSVPQSPAYETRHPPTAISLGTSIHCVPPALIGRRRPVARAGVVSRVSSLEARYCAPLFPPKSGPRTRWGLTASAASDRDEAQAPPAMASCASCSSCPTHALVGEQIDTKNSLFELLTAHWDGHGGSPPRQTVLDHVLHSVLERWHRPQSDAVDEIRLNKPPVEVVDVLSLH